jgi:hypothetical protein
MPGKGRLLVRLLPAVLIAGGLTGSNGASASTALPAVQERVTNLTGASQSMPTNVVQDLQTRVPTELIGFDWSGAVSGEIVLRPWTSTGWSDWTVVDGDPAEGPDANSREYRNRTAAGPVWVGHSVSRIQFRVTSGNLVDFRVHAIHSAATDTPTNLPSGNSIVQPAIISRAAWGADESWRTYAPGCDGSVGYADNVHYLIIHHTATPNSYGPTDSPAIVRGIYYFHTHTNLWCDLGYNFLIDQYGQVFEGRYGGITRAVIGAQAGGFNTGSSGIALIGTFDSAFPSPAMYSALRSVVGWKASLHGINPQGNVTVVAHSFPAAHWPPGTNVTLPTIIGHSDVDATGCPGALAYALIPQLRADVARDIGLTWVKHFSGWAAEFPAPPNGMQGAPAVASWGDDRFDQFVRGHDNLLYHRWSDDGGLTFSGWESLGSPPGGLTSSPSAVSWGFDRIDVFGRGGDGALWHAWWDGAGWVGWESLGGILTSAPAVTAWTGNRLDAFVIGTDRAVWHVWWDGSRWVGWESLGGIGVFDPAAASWGPGRIDLFSVGSDGGLWHRWYDGGWSGWAREVPGTWATGPAAASWGPGRVDVFIGAAPAGTPIAHVWYAGVWAGESLGGYLAAAPAAVSWRYNSVDAFVHGTDGNLWHNGYPGST